MYRANVSQTGGRSPGSALKAVHDYRSALRLTYPRLLLVSVCAWIGGLAQAGVILVVVRLATAITADTDVISGSVGPIHLSGLTTTDLALLGFGLVGVLVVFEGCSAALQSHLVATTQRAVRGRMIEAFSNAAFAAQTHLPRGETQEVLMGLSGRAQVSVFGLAVGATALANFLALAVFALILSPTGGLLVLLGMAALIVLFRPLMIASKRFGMTANNQQRALAAQIAERLELGREIHSFGVGQAADASLLDGNDRLARTNFRVRLLAGMSGSVFRGIAFSLVLVMLAVIDASNVSEMAALTGSMLMLIRALSYGQRIQSALQAVNESASSIHQLRVEEERLTAAAETHAGTDQATTHIPRLDRLTFDSVGYTYPNGTDALADVRMEINRGDFVAVVGRSGGGKSTLMQLMLRLREPTAGQMMANGIPVNETDLSKWRQMISYVPQEPKLSNGTVLDAVRFYRPSLTGDELLDALRGSHVLDELQQSPGLAGSVGPGGEELSGGQRQRVAIARALAGKPELLLLDEPTSALDAESEHLIKQTLEALQGSITIVVIAHRLSTVENADRILVVADGRLTETSSLADAEHWLNDSQISGSPR